ncbi:MAG: hypothetical protein F8N37_11260 [Telmatospirillum sp.]|nr:hypothetical protein [Telmatospirillum sp.]
MSARDYLTIVGRDDDTGEATVVVVAYDPVVGDPHMTALRHTAEMSDHGEFEVVAVFRGQCDLLVTQQSLRLFASRILRQ